MTSEPYKSARRVFWIVDNGSSHAGRTSIKRMHDNDEHARLIHLPIHASWRNQAELFFSILQRKALTPNDCPDLDALAERLLEFGRHYRQIARPAMWAQVETRSDTIRYFHPGWFASVMGTGIIAVATHHADSVVSGLEGLAVVLWILTAVMFVGLIVPWVLRWIRFPAEAWADTAHPTRGPFTRPCRSACWCSAWTSSRSGPRT